MIYTVESERVLAQWTAVDVSASCNSGDLVLSGGFDTVLTYDWDRVEVTRSEPDGGRWVVRASARDNDVTVKVKAICLAVN